MSLHFRNGREATLGDWNGMTKTLITDWALDFDMKANINTVASAWVTLFAAGLRKICDAHGIPIDRAHQETQALQQRITPHLLELKYYLSEAARCDVGLPRAAETVRKLVIAEKIAEEQRVQFKLVFPSVDRRFPAFKDSIEFHTEGAVA